MDKYKIAETKNFKLNAFDPDDTKFWDEGKKE